MKLLYRVAKSFERAVVVSTARRLNVMGYKQEAKQLLETYINR